MTGQRSIRVLNPCSAWGKGHIQTCINLLKGMHRAGAKVHLHLLRARVDMSDVPHSAAVRWPLSRFGLQRLEAARHRSTERDFLAKLQTDEIAWLWPTVSLETYHEVKARGNPIIMEGINTRMGSARRILDRVYDDIGLPSKHDITDGRVAEEEEMLAMASHFFAPNAAVEAALWEEDSSYRGKVLSTSYGAWISSGAPVEQSDDDMVRVVFSGLLGPRKNAHGVLRAWRKLNPSRARLLLCGALDEDVARLCAEELAMPSVEAPGHVNDMVAAYRSGHIFVMPSFEEGGPQVTYEAAGHGLALIASPMGAGRLQEHEDSVLTIDPYDVADMANKIGQLITDPDLRKHYARRAHELAPLYDWNAVGRRRYEQLKETFDGV